MKQIGSQDEAVDAEFFWKTWFREKRV